MDQVSFSANQYNSVSSPSVNMIDPAGGTAVWVMGILVIVKALSTDTGGSYSLFEAIAPPGKGPVEHIHTQEDETWYMIEGELSWTAGGQQFSATKGCFMHLPRNIPHTFINKSDKPAHMVVTSTPGGFEKWFIEIGEPVADRYAPGEAPTPSPEAMNFAAARMKEYGITLAGDDHGEKDVEDLTKLHGSF